MTRRSTIAALILGGLIGAAVKDPEVEVRRVTITEQVEVPGPTVVRSTTEQLPESCLSMIDGYLGQVDWLREYSAAVADQPMALRRAAIAAHQQDIDLINASLTEQAQIESEATGPLREVIQGQSNIDRLQQRCAEERRE